MSSIKISGLGFNTEIQVEAGESYADAFSKAGIDPVASGLDVVVNGSEVTDLNGSSPSDGEQVVTTPKNAALGS